MLFNSAEFLLFLPVVFALYWIIGSHHVRWQNLLILISSYFFYGWWDWRFLGLIAFSTIVDFISGQQINKAHSASHPGQAKTWLWVSLAANLGMLAYFKYANFFIQSWIDAWASLGVQMQASSLQIILPVGISFYTFQTLSYTVDIHRRQLKPTRNLVDFAAFVSFFPQLVAGPIERASKLLPQITSKRTFDHEVAVSGLRLILWGMFKKVVVADTCAIYVNDIFENYETYSGPTLILGMVYFAFQIYGDFSGYSDIAIGTARLFGIQLMANFKTPFFSKSIPEFWNRWHISLNTWMNDYVFFPMAFALRGLEKWGLALAVLLTFLISGLWHGSDWKFVVWGGIHGLAFMPYILKKSGPFRLFSSYDSGNQASKFKLKDFALMLIPFAVNLVAWVFFRADSIQHASEYLAGWFRLPTLEMPITQVCKTTLAWISLTIGVDWLGKDNKSPQWWTRSATKPLRWLLYGWAAWLCIKNLNNGADFIYFQF